ITQNVKKVMQSRQIIRLEILKPSASLVFVKRMMAVAVSSITYLRGIFPEDAYRSRYLEDLCIKVLREDCSTPGANKIVKWMMGSFHALEKQYVRVFFFCFCFRNMCIIESYQFKFKYTEKGPELNIIRKNAVQMQVTLEDTKRASVLLIRKLFLLMQNLGSLPNNVYLTMKLYYYDDMTPGDYEPPGFKEGECDSLWFEGTAIHFKVGDVQTPFHTLRVRVSAEQGRMAKLQEGNRLRDTKRKKNGKMFILNIFYLNAHSTQIVTLKTIWGFLHRERQRSRHRPKGVESKVSTVISDKLLLLCCQRFKVYIFYMYSKVRI
uniref:HORMA domain-containing protein n=1 Tax=Periophthalmus magnuspinnatus TaxID=409849 RepID=A0A3B4A1M8_9GOBI